MAGAPARHMRLRRSGAILALFVAAACASAQTEGPRSSAEIPTPRTDPLGAQRSAQLATLVAEGRPQLVFLGDSITEGWAFGGRSVWERFYGARAPLNLGVSGDRIEHVLWRIEHHDFARLDPRAIVVMIGTNNVYANTSAEIAAGVEALVDALRARVPRSTIVLLGIFPRGSREVDPLRQKVADANRRVRSLRLPCNVLYLDIRDAFVDAGGSVSSEIMPDELHLSTLGYQRWACAIEPTLQRLLGGEAPAAAGSCGER